MPQPPRIAIAHNAWQPVQTHWLALGVHDVTVVHDGTLMWWDPRDAPLRAAEFQPDGMVLMMLGEVAAARVATIPVPQVGIELATDVGGVQSVRVDDAAVGELAANYLMQRGARSFGGHGWLGEPFAGRRIDSFRRTVTAIGERYVEGGHVLHSPVDEQRGRAARAHLIRWLRSMTHPAGVFVACDHWGAELTTTCQMAGLRVPEDVLILSVDNIETVCQLVRPPMSSIVIPWRKLGQVAGQLLMDMIHRTRPPAESPVLVSPSSVASRRSTDLVAVGDPDVAAALRYIQLNAHRRLTVRELLEQVPAERHRLEKGFRRYLGRTMLAEIRRVHVEQAKWLLSTTELPVVEVALKTGFSNVKRLAEAFKMLVRMTPSAYRRKYGFGHANRDMGV